MNRSIAMKKTMKKYHKDFINQLGKSLVLIVGVVGSLGTILQLTGVIQLEIIYLIITLLIILLISLCYSIIFIFSKFDNEPIKITTNEITGVESSELSDELITTVKKLHSKNNHIEVVRLCSNLSRPLWISGKYLQRVAMGAYYEDSALRINQVDDQICALIDDLGWTNAVIGNIDKAIENIENGINIAERHSFNYLAAKGYRHLGTIKLRYNEDYTSSVESFDKALKISEKIESENKKSEMIAGITFNLSEAYLLNNNTDKAMEYAVKSKDLFSKSEDKIRLIKVNNQLANILIAKNDKNSLKQAKEILVSNLTEARNLARVDETGKCLLYLGEIHIKNQSFDLAKNLLNEALSIFKELNSEREAKSVIERINFCNSQIIKIK
ncbi:MAG: tetratricopeptide repeat protein [Bacteroidetes bacterium]|nr:tetratricopeptide repeat protein [Bacteroidota bacterium]